MKLKQFIQIYVFYTNMYIICNKYQTYWYEIWYSMFNNQISLSMIITKEGNIVLCPWELEYGLVVDRAEVVDESVGHLSNIFQVRLVR